MLSLGVVPKDYPNNVAADWPHLISIVEAKVKADRMGFAFLPTGMVYSEQLVVFATSNRFHDPHETSPDILGRSDECGKAVLPHDLGQFVRVGDGE